ncbi:Protein kinase domain [Dillenia turbinata]|uniref:Protein kinase domain n=1 Tax=Dillenia turbinata TaxID=194707 RepID=A0AAN8YSM1_9MAGN
MKHRGEEPERNLGDGVSWRRGCLIGKGSFGRVYLGYSKSQNKNAFCPYPPVMAVKSAEISDSATLQKEKETLFNLQSPNILTCFGEEITTSDNGSSIYNLLLEYCSGGTLDHLIHQSGGRGLPESNARHYTRSILNGVSYIHENGYVHCDLKPDNVLLVPTPDYDNAKNFVAKIGDFGSAKRYYFKDSNKKRRVDPEMRGTLMYLSPEVVNDNVQGPPSDIWAVGCIVLQMLTGRPPWKDKSEFLDQMGHGGKTPEIPGEISDEAKDFIKRCFVRNPMFRFTAEMLLNHPFVSDLRGDDDDDDGSGELLWPMYCVDDECSSSLFLDDECLNPIFMANGPMPAK